MIPDEQKKKALEATLSQIEKQFGKGAIMKFDAKIHDQMPIIPTGSIGLDLALGVGGIPQGRIIEIFGPESSGKTTLTLHLAAECQKQGGTVAFIDAEHALDTKYAKNLGVDVSKLLISQPDSGEEALEITDLLVRSGGVNLLIIDSVAALTPKAELEGDMGDSHMGLQARLMSQALRKLTGSISRTHCTVIFINQLRMKIGTFFGNPETTTGGNALKFYASVRIDIRRIGAVKNGDNVIGNKTKIKIVKNKVAPPFKEVELDILYGEGFSALDNLIDTSVDEQLIEKAGSWYSYKEEKLGQGKESVKNFLINKPSVQLDLRNALYIKHGLNQLSTKETKKEKSH